MSVEKKITWQNVFKAMMEIISAIIFLHASASDYTDFPLIGNSRIIRNCRGGTPMTLTCSNLDMGNR